MTQQEICAEVYKLLQRGDSQGARHHVESNVLDPYFLAQIGWTAIDFNNMPILQLLLDRTRPLLNSPWSLKPDETFLVKMLDCAATRGNLAAVQMLVENYEADVNSPATIGLGPVIGHAVASNNVALVEWMLNHGANPNSTAHGCRACYGLMTAAHNKNFPMVKLLVERGGLINGLNAFGLSPLSYALMGGSQEVIDYLRSVGAQEPWQIRGEPPPPPPPPEGSFAHHLRMNLGCAEPIRKGFNPTRLADNSLAPTGRRLDLGNPGDVEPSNERARR